MKNVLLSLALLVSSMAFSQLNMTTEKAYGQEFEYDFKDYAKIDLTFNSETALYWVERTSGTDANEKINTIHINEHTTLTSWKEKNKTIVSLYSDFSTGQTYGYQYLRNGKIRQLIGTIKLKTKASLPETKEEAKDPVLVETANENLDLIAKTTDSIEELDAPSVKKASSLDEEPIEKAASKTAKKRKVPGMYPEGSSKLLTINDIESLDAEGLKIMRNEIFARYGHRFNEGGEMDLYFKSQSWYTSKDLDATILISEVEKQNIALIRSLE